MPARRRAPLPGLARGTAGLLVLACVVLGIASASIYELWSLAHEPRWADLKLDASPAAGQIQLHWDRTSPAVMLASRGTLSVTDGATRKNLELSGTEIRSGKYLYRPSHADLLFRLRIYGSGIKSSGDSLRVVSLPRSTPARVAAAPVHTRPAASAPSFSASPGVPLDRQPDQTAPGEAHPATGEDQPRTGEASRSQSPPIHEPPAAAAEPAVALQEVQPEIPEGIRSRIESRMVVPVEVHVSSTGAVTQAVSGGKGDSVYNYLAAEAIKAARSWRFSPAKSADGTPVASNKTLEFVFTPLGQ